MKVYIRNRYRLEMAFLLSLGEICREREQKIFEDFLQNLSDLRLLRKGPGTDYGRTGTYTGIGTFTIVEEADGKGASKWGLLKSYQSGRSGWVALITQKECKIS